MHAIPAAGARGAGGVAAGAAAGGVPENIISSNEICVCVRIHLFAQYQHDELISMNAKKTE